QSRAPPSCLTAPGRSLRPIENPQRLHSVPQAPSDHWSELSAQTMMNQVGQRTVEDGKCRFMDVIDRSARLEWHSRRLPQAFLHSDIGPFPIRQPRNVATRAEIEVPPTTS